ncbi:MAG: peptidyl-prolyl cis-trans isomerase, partial [Chloroflexota bacterium]|nr:peptidyl-prolyl cis-trans isomerase [Chloroflexota bacterium]
QQFIVAPALDQKIQTKLAAGVARYQSKVRASHILIPTAKKALAEKLLTEVKNGANFAALAKKYSTDPGSKVKGGDLGWFAHGTMVAPFDQAAFSMHVGQVRLVQSQFGWHIIKVTGREKSRLTPQEYSQQQQSAFSNWLAKEKAGLHIQQIIPPASLPNPVTPQNPLSNIPQVPPVAPSAPGRVTSHPAPIVPSVHKATKGTTTGKTTKKP